MNLSPCEALLLRGLLDDLISSSNLSLSARSLARTLSMLSKRLLKSVMRLAMASASFPGGGTGGGGCPAAAAAAASAAR